MTAVKKSSVFSNLFLKLIEQPNEKEIVEEVIPEGMVKTIDGTIIAQKDAMMVIKRGKVIGWRRF